MANFHSRKVRPERSLFDLPAAGAGAGAGAGAAAAPGSVHSPAQDLDLRPMRDRLGGVLGHESHSVAEAAQLGLGIEEADADPEDAERGNSSGDAERPLLQLAQCRRRLPTGD